MMLLEDWKEKTACHLVLAAKPLTTHSQIYLLITQPLLLIDTTFASVIFCPDCQIIPKLLLFQHSRPLGFPKIYTPR